ncbi:hypothetical protein ACFV4N_42955, partial [Actinosynnema sp. NPDC059797]
GGVSRQPGVVRLNISARVPRHPRRGDLLSGRASSLEAGPTKGGEPAGPDRFDRDGAARGVRAIGPRPVRSWWCESECSVGSAVVVAGGDFYHEAQVSRRGAGGVRGRLSTRRAIVCKDRVEYDWSEECILTVITD